MNRRAVAYLVSLVAVGAAFVARWLADPVLGDHIPYATFFVAVAVSGWFGGLRPALLATAVSLLLAWYFFVPLRSSFELKGGHHNLGLLMFATASAAIAGLSEAMRSAQRRADEGREFLRITLASVGDAVITTDAEGRVASINAVAESLTGWKQAEAAGVPLSRVFQIVNEETRQPAADPAKRALEEGVIVGLANHTVLIARNGSEHAIDDSAAPIRDAHGQVAGAILIFRDITEQRQAARRLAESDARKAAMLQTALDCIITIDHEGKIVEFNGAAENTFGYRRGDVLGRELAELIIPLPLRESHRRGMAHYLATGEGPYLDRRVELPALRSDGSEFPVEFAVSRIPTDGPPLFTAYLRDITERKQSEVALRSSELRHRRLFETSTDGILILDAYTAKITDANPIMSELLGLTSAELVGKELWEVGLFPDKDAGRTAMRDVQQSQYLRCPTLALQTRAGRRIDVELVCSTYVEDEVPFIQCSVRDVTDRKRVQEADARLAAIVESTDDAIVSKSLDGIIQSWNAGAERLFGYAEWQAVGRHISFLIPADRAPEEDRILARIKTGDRIEHYDTVRQRSDGQLVNVSLTISPIKDAEGRVIGASKIARDITERKFMESELRLVAAELSDADRRKNEFLAMLAHELRNPLAPIRNAVDILRLAGSGDPAVASATDMLERQVGQMVSLVEDLLDVSRISRGKIELRSGRIDLASSVNHAVESVRPLVQAKQHDLTVTLPPQPVYLKADPTRLAQVVGNLLNNACKFTNPGGRIWLTVERAGTQAVIRVRDTGAGIAAEKLPHVFDMFMQADTSLERSASGLGIGLTLVKRLVEMHGGMVEAHSAGENQGSEFIVRLPLLLEAAAPAPEPLLEQPADVTRRRILVVDDNPDSAASVAMLLQLMGNEAHTAHDGLEALEAMERQRPDVVLLDIGLPKLNGYEVCRKIREKAWGRKIVMVALTGWGQEEDRRKSLDAGFDDHLVKPADREALAKLLASLPPPER